MKDADSSKEEDFVRISDIEYLRALVGVLDPVYRRILCIDAEGRLVFLSQRLERAYKVELDEAAGRHVTEIIKHSRLHIVAKTGKPELGKLIKGKNGGYRIVDRFPVRREGNIIGAISKIMPTDLRKVKNLTQRIYHLENEISGFRDQIRDLFHAKYTFDDILGESPAIQKVKEMAWQTARASSTILIQGESGTGKELFAHAVHNASTRRRHPFVRINCASIPPDLFESEFFGYQEGAFTGAERKGKKGLFLIAHKGTIFLDEISEMPIFMQAKLLRVLQEKEILPIGGDKPIHVDFRLITSTNKILEKLTAIGLFREDLLYRLNVITLTLPPLRERKEDIDLIALRLIREFNLKLGTSVTEISEKAHYMLRNHDWRGNIRELRNAIERALTICQDEVLSQSHLQSYFQPEQTQRVPKNRHTLHLKDAVKIAEKQAVIDAIELAEGNKVRASQLLGISRSGLYQKMHAYDIC